MEELEQKTYERYTGIYNGKLEGGSTPNGKHYWHIYFKEDLNLKYPTRFKCYDKTFDKSKLEENKVFEVGFIREDKWTNEEGVLCDGAKVATSIRPGSEEKLEEIKKAKFGKTIDKDEVFVKAYVDECKGKGTAPDFNNLLKMHPVVQKLYGYFNKYK